MCICRIFTAGFASQRPHSKPHKIRNGVLQALGKVESGSDAGTGTYGNTTPGFEVKNLRWCACFSIFSQPAGEGTIIARVESQFGKPDQRFPRCRRIRLRDEFARIYAARRYATDNRLTVYVLENYLPYPRLGLSVSRKSGGAVERNRIKRRLREVFRTRQELIPAGLDLICVVRGPSSSAAEYAESLGRLIPKACQRTVR